MGKVQNPLFKRAKEFTAYDWYVAASEPLWDPDSAPQFKVNIDYFFKNMCLCLFTFHLGGVLFAVLSQSSLNKINDTLFPKKKKNIHIRTLAVNKTVNMLY